MYCFPPRARKGHQVNMSFDRAIVKVYKKALLVSISLLFFGLLDIHAQSVLRTDLYLSDIAYHPTEDVLYGLQPSNTYYGNTLLIINPQNALVMDTIALDASPSICRFSPDYRYLYIGYLGGNWLDRFDTQSRILERFAEYEWAETGETSTDIRTNEFLPLPNDQVLVATRQMNSSPESEDMQVYTSNGVLPTQISWTSDQSRVLIYQTSTGTIYGFGHEYRDGGLMRYTVDEQGVSLDQEFDILRRDRQRVFLHNDRLYFQYGDVVDISGLTPTVVGNYRQAFGNPSYSYGVAAMNTAENILYVIDYRSRFGQMEAGNYLYLVDPDNFTEIERRLLPDMPNDLTKMIPTGAERFAIIAKEDLINDLPLPGSLVILGACSNVTEPTELTLNIPRTEFCEGDTLRVGAPSGYDRIIWQDGSTGDSLVLGLPFRNQWVITAKALDMNGCVIAASPEYIISSVSPPAQLSVSGPDRFCQGDEISLETFSQGADRWNWSTGAMTADINVTEAGTYTVRAYKGECEQYLEAQIDVDYYSLDIPTPIISPAEQQSGCLGDTVMLTTDPAPLPYTIEWSHNSGSYPEQAIVTYGNFSVRYRDAFGCYGSPSETTEVFLGALPTTPDIFRIDTFFWVRNNFRDYDRQWLRDGVPIPDSTGMVIVPDTSGFYSIIVRRFTDCWSNPSAPLWHEGIPSRPADARLRTQVFVDYDDNGIVNGNDFYLAQQRLSIDNDELVGFSNEDGQLSFLLSPSTYTVAIDLDIDRWQTAPNLQIQIADLINHPDSIYQFPVQPVSEVADGELLITASPTRCNEPASVWVDLRNTGTLPISGEVCLLLDPLIPELIVNGQSITPVPEAYCWEVETLLPDQQLQQQLTIRLPSEDFTGETLQFVAEFSNVPSPLSLETTYESLIRCAYDPNDKQVSPAFGFGENYALLDDTLRYTIRFQNTGNDVARRVRLEDQLSDDLRWETFHPIAASHDYEVLLKAQTGELEVLFDNIMLPDSNTNLAASQGFFTFGILPKDGLEDFSVVDNTAGIYFDFNAPIITNTIQSTLVSTFDADNDGYELWLDCRDDLPEVNPGATEVPGNGLDDDCMGGDVVNTQELLAEGLRLFPNPTTNLLYLTQTNPAELELQLYNPAEQLLKQTKLGGSRSVFDLHDLPAGVYLLQVQRGDLSGVFRVVKL